MRYLTVYAFSTENWRRPQEEVDAIMGLLEKYLGEAIEKNGAGRHPAALFRRSERAEPRAFWKKISRTDEISTHLHGFQANVCLNYGGRDEIVRAARALCPKRCRRRGEHARRSGLFRPAGTPPAFRTRTCSSAPAGEQRLSNFLLWQCAYSELVFTDTLWPDFTPAEINRAIAAYQKRERRFGAI